MPNEPLKVGQPDATVKAWYRDAVAAGLPASLMRADGYLESMQNWNGDKIAKELRGFRWHEYIDPEHIGAVLSWIADPDATDPITYRAICPNDGQPRLMWYGLTKVSGKDLRLIIGTGRPVVPVVPAH